MDITTWLPILYRAWKGKGQGIGGSYPNEQEYKALAEGVKRLTRGFTGYRNLVGSKYLEEDRSLGAYLHYYWPLSYIQARSIFDEILGSIEISDLPRSIVDCGSGPGPVGFAAVDAVKARGGNIEQVLFLDHSQKSLDQALALAKDAHWYPEGEIKWEARQWNALQGGSVPSNKGKSKGWGLVTFGHSLNEMWQGRPDGLEKRTNLVSEALGLVQSNGFLMIMEPALRDSTEDLLRLRDNLVLRGAYIVGPCAFQQACPALAAGQTCHGQVWEKLPRVVRTLADMAGLHKEGVTMSWLALQGAKSGVVSPKTWFRVVGEPMVNKAGRTRIMVCGEKGRFSFSAKLDGDGLGKNQKEQFAHLKRGERIMIINGEDREGGIGLLSTTEIKKL